MKRRDFLKIGSATGISGLIHNSNASAFIPDKAGKPIVIASGNGLESVKKAYQMINNGHDALDAVIAGVNLVEDAAEGLCCLFPHLGGERGTPHSYASQASVFIFIQLWIAKEFRKEGRAKDASCHLFLGDGFQDVLGAYLPWNNNGAPHIKVRDYLPGDWQRRS